MTTSDWINLIAAILVGGGTITLAVMTWRAIRQTRNIHKKEEEQRLLNEIIEWAADLNKCAWESEYTISAGVSLEEYQIYREANIFSRWRAADAKSEFIRSIALTFGEDLHSAVENVKKQLDKLLALKWKSLTSEKDEEKNKLAEEIKDTEGKLYKSVNALTRVAAKYKTRDIG